MSTENETESRTNRTPRTNAMLEQWMKYKDTGNDVCGPTDLCRILERELAAERAKVKKLERVSMGYLRNAAGDCPACAEGVCCGSVSTFVQHKGCVFEERDQALAEVAALRKCAEKMAEALEYSIEAIERNMNIPCNRQKQALADYRALNSQPNQP